MTTEELDALDALLRERNEAQVERDRTSPLFFAMNNEHPKKMDDRKRIGREWVEAAGRLSRAQRALKVEMDAVFPRLLASARQAATLRAKLAESETWRTELRQEMDAVKGKLREVLGQRDELREAADALTDHIDGLDCNVYWPRLAKALEAAR